MNRLGKSSSEESQNAWDISPKALLKIIFAVAAVTLITKIFTIILLIFLGFLLAVSLEPLVRKLQDLGLKRSYAIACIASAMMLVIALVGVVIVPDIYSQISSLILQMPELKSIISNYFNDNSPLKAMASQAMRNFKLPDSSILMANAAALLNSVIEGMTEVFLVLIFSIYLLIDGKRAFKWFSDFFTAPTRLKLEATAREASLVIYGYVMGQVLTSVLSGIYAFIILSLLKVPAALTLAVLAGIFDILPILGFFMAVIPAILLAFTVSPFTGVLVFGLYVLYHAFENYWLVPFVYGNSMKVSTLVVLIALLVAGSVGGLLAALAILPLVASYPIIERIWLVKYLGRQVIKKHAADDDNPELSEQVQMWGENRMNSQRHKNMLPQNQLVKGLSPKVLIVDDDEDIRSMLADILATEGYRCLLASNGKEGLYLLKVNSDIGLIMLDLMMPVMNGNDFLKIIKANSDFSRIPVVFLSSSVDSMDTSGADGVLKKPTQIDSVLDIVEKYCQFN